MVLNQILLILFKLSFYLDDQYKMPGMISCIAFSKTSNGIYAAGSYTKFSNKIFRN